MPCTDFRDHDNGRYGGLEQQIRIVEARLCAVLTALEKTKKLKPLLEQNCDWQEAGVSLEDTLDWWTHHKEQDAHRRKLDAKRNADAEEARKAYEALTPKQRKALNLTPQSTVLNPVPLHPGLPDPHARCDDEDDEDGDDEAEGYRPPNHTKLVRAYELEIWRVAGRDGEAAWKKAAKQQGYKVVKATEEQQSEFTWVAHKGLVHKEDKLPLLVGAFCCCNVKSNSWGYLYVPNPEDLSELEDEDEDEEAAASMVKDGHEYVCLNTTHSCYYAGDKVAQVPHPTEAVRMTHREALTFVANHNRKKGGKWQVLKLSKKGFK